MPYMRFERFRFFDDADVPAQNVQATGQESDQANWVPDTLPLALGNVNTGAAKEGVLVLGAGQSGQSTRVRVTFTYGATAVDEMLPTVAGTILNDVTVRFYKVAGAYYLAIYGLYVDQTSIAFERVLV